MSRKMNVNKMKHPSDVHGLAKHGERQFSRRSGYIFDSTLLVIIIVNQPHNANNFAYLSGGGTHCEAGSINASQKGECLKGFLLIIASSSGII